MCTLGALWKARLREIKFSGDFLGVFAFLRSACSLGIPQEDLEILENLRFSQTPLVNPLVFAMHLVCTLLKKKTQPKSALQSLDLNKGMNCQRPLGL